MAEAQRAGEEMIESYMYEHTRVSVPPPHSERERAAVARLSAATPEGHISLENSSRLLAMFVNRGNSGWAAARDWCAPTMWTKAQQDDWAG